MYSDYSIEQMAIAATQFNIFGSVTQKEISVGYISSIRGYVPSISLCEANDHEKEYPNTAFILKNRDKICLLYTSPSPRD